MAENVDSGADIEYTIVLPPRVVEFLLSPQYSASLERIQKIFRLSGEDITFLGDLNRLVMGGELEVDAYIFAIQDEFSGKLPKEQIQKLIAEILADHFIPLGDYLKPGAIDVARQEKLQLPARPYYRIYVQPLTYSRAATEISSMVGFQLAGEQMRERLRDLLMSRKKGVRVTAEVIEALKRGGDFGGLGFDADMAEKTVKAMEDIIQRAELMTEDEYSNWLASEAQRTRDAEERMRAPKTKDDLEIEKIQASMPKPNLQAMGELERAIEITFQRVSVKPEGEYLEKRLRNIISSRLRDIRNVLELKQLLMRDSKVGGLGLDVKQAEILSQDIEDSYREFHEKIAHEEKGKIEKQLEEQKHKVEERKQQEAEDHARWFEEKIRSRKAQESQKSQALEGMRRIIGNAGPTSSINPSAPAGNVAHPLDIKEHRIEEKKFGPLQTLPQAAPQPQTIAQTEKVQPSIKVSPATIELSQAAIGARPSVDGIRYAGPQLIGLVGELRALSVSELRRLSKDPKESMRKILQKIETLGQESFEKKVEGIRAFQQSPLQTAYLQLVGESFRSMKPVIALAEEKRKAGEDILSPEEIGAIIQLNSALHF